MYLLWKGRYVFASNFYFSCAYVAQTCYDVGIYSDLDITSSEVYDCTVESSSTLHAQSKRFMELENVSKNICKNFLHLIIILLLNILTIVYNKKYIYIMHLKFPNKQRKIKNNNKINVQALNSARTCKLFI